MRCPHCNFDVPSGSPECLLCRKPLQNAPTPTSSQAPSAAADPPILLRQATQSPMQIQQPEGPSVSAGSLAPGASPSPTLPEWQSPLPTAGDAEPTTPGAPAQPGPSLGAGAAPPIPAEPPPAVPPPVAFGAPPDAGPQPAQGPATGAPESRAAYPLESGRTFMTPIPRQATPPPAGAAPPTAAPIPTLASAPPPVPDSTGTGYGSPPPAGAAASPPAAVAPAFEQLGPQKGTPTPSPARSPTPYPGQMHRGGTPQPAGMPEVHPDLQNIEPIVARPSGGGAGSKLMVVVLLAVGAWRALPYVPDEWKTMIPGLAPPKAAAMRQTAPSPRAPATAPAPIAANPTPTGSVSQTSPASPPGTAPPAPGSNPPPPPGQSARVPSRAPTTPEPPPAAPPPASAETPVPAPSAPPGGATRGEEPVPADVPAAAPAGQDADQSAKAPDESAAAPAGPKKAIAGLFWTFEGQIYDVVNLRPVFDAVLTFEAEGLEHGLSTHTNEYGRYRIRLPALSEGGYRLQIRHADYRRQYFDETRPPYRTMSIEDRRLLTGAVTTTHHPWIGRAGRKLRHDMVLIPGSDSHIEDATPGGGEQGPPPDPTDAQP